MTRILVTGASGFIGSHVARHFHAQGHHVIATGRDKSRLDILTREGLRTRIVDLSTDAVLPLTDGTEIVIHCAALSSPWGRREQFMAANVRATKRLLDASRQSGVRRLIHFSSPSIYFRFGDQLNTAEAFKPPRRWINAYAETKWMAEQCVREAASAGLPALILRPRAVFGEGDRGHIPAPAWIGETRLVSHDWRRKSIDRCHLCRQRRSCCAIKHGIHRAWGRSRIQHYQW